MKKLIVYLLVMGLCCIRAYSAEVEFFTGKKAKVLNADPDQTLIRSIFLQETGGYFSGDKMWDVGIGGDVPFLRVLSETKEIASMNIRGYFRSHFIVASKSFDLLNTDYTGGISTVAGEESQWEFYLYHKSSHMGDEVLLDTSTYKYNRINYSREVVRIMRYVNFANDIKAAFGIHFILRKDPNINTGRLVLQHNYEIPFKVNNNTMFFNADFKSNEEHGWNTDMNIQLGIDLGKNKPLESRQTFTLEYYDGYSRMGQFYEQKEKYISLGIVAKI